MEILDFIDKLQYQVDKRGMTDKSRILDGLRAYVNNIPTEKGKMYAISKTLNDYGFDSQEFKRLPQDFWSLKHQEDYTPPDVEKTLKKRNKEQAENFWNWDSDEHWTKKNVDELKRQAKDAGYDNFPAYLDKVREVQTNKDREKLYDENAMPGTKLFLPRMTEAVLRGEDPTKRDIGLDFTENALYLLNPAGRFAKAGLQGAKAGKYLGRVADVADVLANPLTMETLDSVAYGDEDNTDRRDFNVGDVVIGTGINAGMNKVVAPLLKTLVAPVPKSKAQIMAEQEAKLATEEANKVLEDGTRRKTNELMKDITEDELRRQDIREKFAAVKDKREFLRDLKEQLANKNVIEPRKTKFSERLLGDLNLGGTSLDYVSNKIGDLISEDPKLTKKILTKGVRGITLAPEFINDLASDYYNRKEKNVEQEKINQAIKLLGRRK